MVAALLAATTSGAVSRPDYSAWEWINHYYEAPQPERFVESIFELSRNGYFEQPHHIPVGIGFVASLFRQNPDRVDEWLLYCKALPAHHQRLIFASLWYSGHPKGTEILEAHAAVTENPQLRALIERLLARSPVLEDTTVHSGRSLHLQWGVFLATGDEATLRAIFEAVGDNDAIPLPQRWQLARNAAKHPRVREYCRRAAELETGMVGDVMRTVLLDFNPTTPSS